MIDKDYGYWPYVWRGETGTVVQLPRMLVQDRHGDRERALSDARLIAAAPDLLTLAKRVLSEGSSDLSKLSANSLHCLLVSLADDARAAIAKAQAARDQADEARRESNEAGL